LPGRFRGAHLKVAHRSMLTLACGLWFTFIGVSVVTVGQRGPLPHRKGRDSGEQHFTEQANRQKNTRIRLLQNKTIMVVSQVYSHTYSRYFAYIYIYIAAKYECIELSAQQRHLDLPLM